jgi:hypothetical protein
MLTYTLADGTTLGNYEIRSLIGEGGMGEIAAVSGFLSPDRYDVSADGQRFLINSVAQETNPTPMTVIVNWAAALKR